MNMTPWDRAQADGPPAGEELPRERGYDVYDLWGHPDMDRIPHPRYFAVPAGTEVTLFGRANGGKLTPARTLLTLTHEEEL